MTTEETSKLSMDGDFYALNEHSDLKIPAVFLDVTQGTEAVLIFSSRDLATKYCYLSRPEAVNSIYKLERRFVPNATTGKRDVLQTGLLRIARTIKVSGLDQIKHFVIDHPGTVGKAKYVTVDDISDYGRVPVGDDISSLADLETFLAKEMEE